MKGGEKIKGDPAPQPAEPFDMEIGALRLQSSGSGGGTGKVKITDILVTRDMDSASSKLFSLSIKGEALLVVLTLYSSSTTASLFERITMQDTLLTNYSVGVGENTVENMTFNSPNIKIEYFGPDD